MVTLAMEATTHEVQRQLDTAATGARIGSLCMTIAAPFTHATCQNLASLP
jgi:polysaccharide deacetylase 2 family uncharacterized protein YibQ